MLPSASSAKLWESIYKRTPVGVCRICVAGISGAIYAFCVGAKNGTSVAREYWYLFAGVGLALGAGGGVIAGVLEKRAASGEGPPLWWRVVSRTLSMFLVIVALGGAAVLAWCMILVMRMDHLYGF